MVAIKALNRAFGLLAGAAVLAVLAAGIATPAGAAVAIPTNLGVGADAEVRQFQPDSARGGESELATRIRDAAAAGETGDSSDRASTMYLRFDISQFTPETIDAYTEAAIRLTYRNPTISQSRIEQTVGDVTKRAGLQYHALNIGHSGENWNETEITFNNAPGMLGGLDPVRGIGVYRYDPAQTTFLGVQDFPDVEEGRSNHPVGGAVDFSSLSLLDHVKAAVNAGQSSVTFLVSTSHDGDPDFTSLVNFNYLFNPKEQTTLLDDATSPWGGASNANGEFSPQLIIIPEPSAIGLLGLGGLALVRRRRC